MLYVTANREDVLLWMPKGSEIAEVGVFSGAWSRKILDVTQPSKLHLIDVWRWISYDWDNPPPSERSNIENFKAWSRSIDPEYDGGHPDKMLARFYTRLVELSRKDKRLTIHKGLSVDVACTFPDASLDCVYLDADHRYDAVLAELFAYAPKVKAGGLIWGDDFLDDGTRVNGLYGVIQAVTTFCKRGEFRPLAIIGPSACQYVLYREMSPYVEEWLSNLLNSGKHIVELNDVLVGRFFQKTIRTSRATRDLASFA
jgi:hypothetical protein